MVNLCSMFNVHHPAEGSIEAPLTVLAELQSQGLLRPLESLLAGDDEIVDQTARYRAGKVIVRG